jgi:hypothetical protein
LRVESSKAQVETTSEGHAPINDDDLNTADGR